MHKSLKVHQSDSEVKENKIPGDTHHDSQGRVELRKTNTYLQTRQHLTYDDLTVVMRVRRRDGLISSSLENVAGMSGKLRCPWKLEQDKT